MMHLGLLGDAVVSAVELWWEAHPERDRHERLDVYAEVHPGGSATVTIIPTAGFLVLEGGTLDIGIIRDRMLDWPGVPRWRARLAWHLPRRWWPRFGYRPHAPNSLDLFRETFEGLQ